MIKLPMRVMVPALMLILHMIVTPAAFAGYDDGARYAFIASTTSKSIVVIDLQGQSLANTIQLQRAPAAVVVSDRLKALVISHAAEKSLTLIDLGSPDLTQLDYPLNLTPSTIAMSPGGETVAIYDRKARKLEIHALRRRAIVLSVDDVNADSEFTFSADGAKIYWVDNAGGTFNSVDLWSDARSVKVSQPQAGLSAMSRSIDGAVGFVSETSTNVVHMIDLLTLTPVLKIHVGSKPGRPWGTADGRYMLVPNKGDGTLTAISTLTGEAVYTVAVVDRPAFVNPGWLDSTAAAVGESGQVAIINVDDGKATHRFDLDGLPVDGVVTSDSRTLAIPVPGNGSLVFFDLQSRTRSSTIPGLPNDIGPVALAISNNLCH